MKKGLDICVPVCYNTNSEMKGRRVFTHTMKKSLYFQTELERITDLTLRDFCARFLDERVGAWFWESGASSSGKFHPVFSQGIGGLVRHVKAACMFLEELLRLSRWSYMPEEYKDYARVAILLHDCAKYGNDNELDKEAYPQHGAICAEMVENFWHEAYESMYGKLPDLIPMAIRSHMGQWVTDRKDRPFTAIDQLVHYADYISSRNFIDIPSITAEYEQIVEQERKELEELTANISVPF